ncbi:MAG: UDP-N-acetylglucosamine 2-epimerase [Acidimicrobiales bacterium]|nr:UDP-N-acetylglucosamine 2-epimerase [Acidimicrobiales bacterium]
MADIEGARQVEAIELVIVAGVRPQYVKTRALLWLLERYAPDLRSRTLTFDAGQHYTSDLSDWLLEDIGLTFDHRVSPPVGSISRVERLGQALAELGHLLASFETSPAVAVFGDASSVLVGSIAAHDLSTPLCHVEAGARRDPLEVEHMNSVMADQLAQLRFAYTERAYHELEAEGLAEGSFIVGDISYEWYRHRYGNPSAKSALPAQSAPIVASMHRPSNMSASTVEAVADALIRHGRPVHWLDYPRTRPFLGLLRGKGITIVPPLGHSGVMRELVNAAFILTDSGGISREAHLLGKPVIMRRDLGGWPELAAHGSLYPLVGRAPEDVEDACRWAENLQPFDVETSPMVRPGGGQLAASQLQALVAQR